MGSSRWIDDDQLGRNRTPSFPCNESVLSRNAQKQRKWKIIYTLLCRWWYDWNCFSHNHFYQSAQYLRSSSRNVWKVQYLSNKHRETCCGRAIRPIFAPAELLIMTPTPSIEFPAQENLLQKHKERVEKLPQPDRLIKVCTDAGFLKTVEVGQYFRTHWRVLTICRASDMSWVFVTTRWEINWPERFGSREHQNWTCIGSHNQFPTR